MVWTKADDEKFVSDAERFRPNLGLLDSMSTGFQEGWDAGPTQALINLNASAVGEKYLTAQEANEKYGLVDTDAAFKEGDELYSDYHAQTVADRWLSRQVNETIHESVKEDYGAVASAFNVVSGIGAGFGDPINLGVGILTAGASRVAGAHGPRVLKEIIQNKTLPNVVKVQLTENFAATAITDLAVIPLSEEVMNENVSTQARVFNVIGGTLLGTAIGTRLDLSAIKKARLDAANMSKKYGDDAPDLADKAMEHSTKNYISGKKLNPDYPVQEAELGWYSRRPHQQEYSFTPVTTQNLNDRLFYIGRQGDKFKNTVDEGSGTITLIDDPNYVENNMVGVNDVETDADVFEFKIHQDQSIISSPDEFFEIQPLLRDKIKDVFARARKSLEDLPLTKAALKTQIQKMNTLIDTAVDFAFSVSGDVSEFKYALEQKILDADLLDPKRMGPVDDYINKALWELGFDGYTGVKSATTLEGHQHNFVVLFKDEFFAPELKTKKTLFRHKNPPPIKPENRVLKFKAGPYSFGDTVKQFIPRRGSVIANSNGDQIFFNTKKLIPENNYAAQIIDPDQADAVDFYKPFKDLAGEEIRRMEDLTQDIDYNTKAMDDLDGNDVKPPKSDDYIYGEDFDVDEVKSRASAVEAAKKILSSSDEDLLKIRKELAEICGVNV